MNDLWADQRASNRQAVEPLAVRMRPCALDEFAGQTHIVGPGTLLRRMLAADMLTSVIFWGPPGVGKTTLAEIIANHTGRHFVRAHAASVGVKEIRAVIADATRKLELNEQRTILFLDEMHRFARNQQDVLLGDVESGLITLIGATTENPYFSINSALVSRSTLFQFEPVDEDDIVGQIRRAIVDARGFGHLSITIDDDALALWATKSDGDVRRALNALEIAVLSESSSSSSVAPGFARGSGRDEPQHRGTREASGNLPSPPAPLPSGERRSIHITLAIAEQSIQHKALVYDGTGDEHYDVVSAFIKSMRGGDPDAAVYWLARMLQAGEDPRFIARRIAILASEDIGNADPNAIQVAAAAYTLTERIGMPECQLTLCQAAIYMACAPKSNASAKAIWDASKDVREGRTIPVPKHLRDSHYAGAQTLGHGENYVSPHNSSGRSADQEYLGVDRVYYQPTDHGLEAELTQRLEHERRSVRQSEAPEHDRRDR